MTPRRWHNTSLRTLARASAMSDLRASLIDQNARERQRVAISTALRIRPDEARDPMPTTPPTTTPDSDPLPDFEDPEE
jgi:hypothetical protein